MSYPQLEHICLGFSVVIPRIISHTTKNSTANYFDITLSEKVLKFGVGGWVLSVWEGGDG